MLSWVTAIPYSPWKHSRMAYMGLVPISPKTTPSAARDSWASRRLLLASDLLFPGSFRFVPLAVSVEIAIGRLSSYS